MTRWFHATAAALLVLSIWAGLDREPGRPNADPTRQLIELLARSGLDYRGDQPLLGGASALTFRLAGCPSDLKLILFPALSRVPSAPLARLDEGGAKATFVHDGDIIDGLGPLDLMPRWFWRKLLVAVRLRPSEPWQSIAFAWLVPRNCATPPIDWRSLTRA
jgi:hypothetical protein